MSTLTAPEPRVRQAAAPGSPARRVHRLGQYTAPDDGQTREIVSLQRPDGSTLVIDRLAARSTMRAWSRELAPEEPAENAQIVAAAVSRATRAGAAAGG